MVEQEAQVQDIQAVAAVAPVQQEVMPLQVQGAQELLVQAQKFQVQL